jgi:hypothetical protein
MLPIPPRAGRDWSVVLATEPLRRWRNFEAEHAAFIAISRPPPAAQDRTPMLFAETFPGRRHLRGSIAFAASRVAVASEPIARPDWPAVNLAEPFAGRRCFFRYSFSGIHTLSITQLAFVFRFSLGRPFPPSIPPKAGELEEPEYRIHPRFHGKPRNFGGFSAHRPPRSQPNVIGRQRPGIAAASRN